MKNIDSSNSNKIEPDLDAKKELELKILEEKRRKLNQLLDDTFNMISMGKLTEDNYSPTEKHANRNVISITEENDSSLNKSSHHRSSLVDKKKQQQQQKHKPVKLHVQHKPTDNDIQRINNPYEFQDEFASYSKNGFLFEPLRQQNEAHIPEPSTTTTINTSTQQQTKIINLKLKKSKRDNTSDEPIYPKIALKTISTSSYQNKAYEPETQFQNFNQLNIVDSRNGNGSTSGSNKTNAASSSGIDSQDRLKPSLKVNSLEYDSNYTYEDEYDVRNKYRKSNMKNNIELVESINKEIDRIKFKFEDDSSLA